ncbi:MAG: polysaccharide deacetylase family protein [Planctomycetota bacterium]
MIVAVATLLLGTATWFVYNAMEQKHLARWELMGSAPSGLPVFMFHEPDAQELEEVLDHLVRNQYITLGVREASDILAGRRPFTGREVLLTFDDGKLALWSYVWPALQKRKLRGVAFVNPGLVTESSLRPQHPGEGPANEDLSQYCSWDELQKAAGQGLDIQSHAWSHEREIYADVALHPQYHQEILQGLVRAKDRLISMGFGRQLLFCAPFGSVSPALEEMALEAGYPQVVGVRPDRYEGFYSPENEAGAKRVIRFNHRSILSLPGEGREGLMGRMWRRLWRGGDRYE